MKIYNILKNFMNQCKCKIVRVPKSSRQQKTDNNVFVIPMEDVMDIHLTNELEISDVNTNHPKTTQTETKRKLYDTPCSPTDNANNSPLVITKNHSL